MSDPRAKERMSECCRMVLVSEQWAADSGQNHRAHEGQLVCTGCGRGFDVTPEEYAAVLATDQAWNAWSRDEGNQP